MKTLANYIHNRNYGCRVKEYTYHGLKTVSIENDMISVVVLADKGTDIIEFVYKPLDVDFMWHSFNGIKNPAGYVQTCEAQGGSFLDYYEGGWQELFPTFGANSDYYGAKIGIHGEVWNLPWSYAILDDKPEIVSVRFWVRAVRTPFYLEKTLTLKLHDASLYMDERVVNEGNMPLEFMWGHHPAFGPVFLDDSCRICVDGDVKIIPDAQCSLEASASDWPLAQDRKGNRIDISRVQHPESRLNISCALEGFKQGRFHIVNTSMGLGFGLDWDKALFPYIWIWEPNATQKSAPWYGRDYVLGIEPWSAIPGDFDEVKKKDKGIRIAPGESILTSLRAYAFREETC